MKKLLAPFVLSAVAAIGMFACLGGDGNGSGGGGGPTSGSMKIISLDQVNNVLITQFVTYSCAGSTVVADTTLDTISFAISGGRILTWNANGDFANDPDECYADVATGISTSIIGTWTAVSTPVPISPQPAGCPVPLPPHSGDGLPEGMTMTYVVTATDVTISVSGNVCLAEDMAQGLADQMPMVTVTSVAGSCNTATLRNDGSLNTVKPTATLTSSMGNGLMTITFQSGATTCTASETFTLPGGAPPVCPEQQITDAFYNCAMGSGFFTSPIPNPMPMPKISVGF